MSKKHKVKRIPTAIYIDPELSAQAKVLFAKKGTNFSAEVSRWLENFVRKNTTDETRIVRPQVEAVPEEEKVSLTKVEVPSFLGQKPESDWF